MGTPKQKHQIQPQQALPKAPTGKRKRPFSSVTNSSNDITINLAEFKRISSKKKQKKRESATVSSAAEVGRPNEGCNQKGQEEDKVEDDHVIQQPTKLQQLSYFLHEYQSANGVQLSSLELDSFKDAYMLDIYQETTKNASGLGEYVKCAFGSSWKEMLCGKQVKEGKVEPGNPSVIVVALSAQRSIELLRELKPLTKECPAVKLFSKHMKIEEQVGLLKKHVNIACGTPNRIKKLIDMEALGLSRLTLVVLDVYRDVKGYSLLTLPQVREEFWHLYKRSFHEKFLGSHLRICLYGSIPAVPVIAVEAADN